jgi:hypothetical protein
MGVEERGDEANQEEQRSEYLESAKSWRWRDGMGQRKLNLAGRRSM